MSDSTTSLLSQEDCNAIIRECIGCSDFEVIGWTTSGRDDDEIMGYLGDHARAEIAILRNGCEEKIPFFLKLKPDKSWLTKFIETMDAAKKELIFYQLWEPELRRGVPAGDRPWGCRCYLAKQDLLVMEDLAVQGYQGYGARDSVDFDHCGLVMDALAALHAASLALEEEKSARAGRPVRLMDEQPDMFVETFYAQAPGKEEFTETGIRALMACARQMPVYRDPMKRVLIEERLPKVLRQLYELVKPSAVDRNTLTHSDMWLNNILFRYDAAGRPVDARLIDWQLVRYSPPVDDVLQFLHTCVPKAFRVRHEVALVDRYYASLTGALGRRGLSSERLLPRAALDKSAARRRLLARLSTVFMNHLVVLDARALADRFADAGRYEALMFGAEREAFVAQQFAEEPTYRARMEEALDDLIGQHVL